MNRGGAGGRREPNWSNTGQILVKYRSFTGQARAEHVKYWSDTGLILGRREPNWSNTGQILVIYWAGASRTGQILVRYWSQMLGAER